MTPMTIKGLMVFFCVIQLPLKLQYNYSVAIITRAPPTGTVMQVLVLLLWLRTASLLHLTARLGDLSPTGQVARVSIRIADDSKLFSFVLLA